MTKLNLRSAAVALLAVGAGLSASSAFAQEQDAAPDGAAPGFVQPYVADEQAFVPPNVMGHYTCSYNELHTRLERKDCGGFSYRY